MRFFFVFDNKNLGRAIDLILREWKRADLTESGIARGTAFVKCLVARSFLQIIAMRTIIFIRNELLKTTVQESENPNFRISSSVSEWNSNLRPEMIA